MTHDQISRNNARKRLTTVRCGIAIFAAVGLSTVGVFLCLDQYCNQLTDVLTHERSELEANLLLNNIIEDSNNLGEHYFWGMFGARKNVAIISKHKTKFASDFSQLRDTAKDQPEILDCAKTVLGLFEKEQKLFKYASENSIYVGQVAEEQPSPAWMDLDKFKTFMDLTKSFRRIKVAEDVRVEKNWTDLKSEQHARDEAIEKFQILLIALVCATAAVSVIATYIVQKIIGNRLRKLLTTADIGVSGLAPDQLLTGKDEFTFLQSVLLKSFESAQKAAEYRSMILSMVAHDVRAPLMSAKANLHLLEEEADGLPDEALTKLLTVYERLDNVLQSTEDVLAPDSVVMISLRQAGEAKSSTKHRNSDSRSRLKIFHLLLIISLIPLLIQVGLLSQLFFRGVEIQKLAKDARTHIDSVQLKNLAVIESILAVNDRFLFFATRAKSYQADAIATFAKASDRIHELSKLTPDSEPASGYITSFMQELNRTKEAMLDPRLATKPISECFDALKSIGVYHDQTESAYRARLLEQKWRSAGQEKVEADSESLKSEAERIRKLVDVALVFNIAVELFFAAMFISLVSKEMQNLTKFAERVGRPDLEMHDTSYHTVEISELNDALIDAHQRLEAVSGMRSAVRQFLSHQLSKQLIEILFDEHHFKSLIATLTPKCTEYLDASTQSVNQSVDILDDLLAAESLEVGAMELNISQFDISKMLASCAANLSGLAKVKDIRITLDSKPLSVDADERRISRVIGNLLSNAIKFSPDGSTISVESRLDGDSLLMQVTDQGAGIPPDELNLIFEPRYRLDATRDDVEGHGIGLAVCKIIVESHNGQLGATSAVGSGSTFWVKLPASPARL